MLDSERWPPGSFFCLSCQGNHAGPSLCAVSPRREVVAGIGDGEGSCYRVAVFSRAAVEAIVGPLVDASGALPGDDDLAIGLTGWRAYYGGPGRSFAHDPSVRVTRRHVVVKQFCGIDI